MTEMHKVIVKNIGASEYFIDDLGIGVPSAGSIDFHEQFSYNEITGSDDLRAAVSGASLIVNDGIQDLPAPSGVTYLKIVNTYNLEDDYYDKVELATPGGAVIHYDNLTNIPTTAANNTLDGAYNEGGPGAGRTIKVDAGSVQLSAADSGYAPIELTEQSTLPTIDLQGGQLAVKDGILYSYDVTRGKWLSTQRMFITFGRRRRTRNQYLNHLAGPSNNSGYRLARNATIVSITGQLDNSGSCNIRIRKNDSFTNIATLNISSAIGDQDTTVNIDTNVGDYLQSYLQASAPGVQDPIVVVEVAWRE